MSVDASTPSNTISPRRSKSSLISRRTPSSARRSLSTPLMTEPNENSSLKLRILIPAISTTPLFDFHRESRSARTSVATNAKKVAATARRHFHDVLHSFVRPHFKFILTLPPLQGQFGHFRAAQRRRASCDSRCVQERGGMSIAHASYRSSHSGDCASLRGLQAGSGDHAPRLIL